MVSEVKKVSPQQQEINEMFVHMEAAIRLNTYESHDFLFMIADLMQANVDLARSINLHAAEFIESEECNEHTTWTDIVVESYRRALFDTTYSPKYATGWFLKNIPAMRKFIDGYTRDQTMPGSHLASSSVN